MSPVARFGFLAAALSLAGCADGMRTAVGYDEPAASAGQTVLKVDDRFRDALRPALVATGYNITGARFAKIVQLPDGAVRACGSYRYIDHLNRTVTTPFAMAGILTPNAYQTSAIELDLLPATRICETIGLT